MRYLLFLVLCPMLYSCNVGSEESYHLSTNSCDTTYSIRDSLNKQISFVCIYNGLLNRVDLDSNGDTLLIIEELSDLVFSKTYFENRRVSKRNLIVRIGERENVNLSLLYNEGELDTIASTFFYSKYKNDSLFFRLNNYNVDSVTLDSIWISEFINYFPSIRKAPNVKYKLKTDNVNTWVHISKDSLIRKKQLVLGFSVFAFIEEDLGGIMFAPYYLDSSIVEWNQQFVPTLLDL
ncbi:hypothetical protein GYB57_07220 [bacterium]|nr:hypothetical protein [bacterium]